MLKMIRKAATEFFIKALVGLLVLSFAAWGIADILTNVSSPIIASVGDKTINTTEFRKRYQEQMNLILARFGQYITPEQSKELGIGTSVLSTMINELASNTHVQQLELSVTDDAVVESIRHDPLFNELDGQFSSKRLKEVLTSLKMSEKEFIEARRTNMLRNHLIDSLSENVEVSHTLLDSYRTFNFEQRKVRYFVINDKAVSNLSKGYDDKILRNFFDANKSLFMTKEKRDIEIMVLSSAEAREKIEVTQDRLMEQYVRDRDQYTVPELRKILQIPFKSIKAAEEARKDIINGKKFTDVAKENGIKEEDLNLGNVSKSEIIDPKIAEIAFRIKKNEISEVVEGSLTIALLMVTNISPNKTIPFEVAKKEILKSIAKSQVPEKINELHDLVDDHRLAGKSLQEISNLLGLTFYSLKDINHLGYGTDGKPSIASTDLSEVVSNAFKSNLGFENDLTELSDGGYAWTNVTKIIKAQQTPFDKAKADVKDLWLKKQKRNAIAKLAQNYVKKLNNGMTFKEVASIQNHKIILTPAFKRHDRLPNLGPTFVDKAFTLATGFVESVPLADKKTHVVFEVAEIIPPQKASDEQEKQLKERLLQNLKANVIDQYMLHLRNRLGVTINQTLINQTIGTNTR
ncbi:MAG: hypothetical protein TECD_00030 [Hyphomicrobiaceae bacterium hypho_1]